LVRENKLRKPCKTYATKNKIKKKDRIDFKRLNGLAGYSMPEQYQKNKAMKKLILFCFLIIFISSVDAQSASAINSKGFRQAKKGNYATAIKFFTKAVQIDQYFTDAWYNRALAYSKLKEYSRAIEDYTKAIDLRPHFKMAYNNRGADKNELKDYAGALKDYTKAIELNSGYAKAWYNRGIVRMNLQEYEKAVSDFTKAIELEPGYKEAHINREIAETKKRTNKAFSP